MCFGETQRWFHKYSNHVRKLLLYLSYCNSSQESDFIKQQHSSKFKIKDMDQIKQCLGMRIMIDKKKNQVLLDKEQYIQGILT